MTLPDRRTFLATSAALGASMLPGLSLAQAKYPDRPITLIDPFTAGSNTDFFSRALSEELAKVLGQPVIVENKAGSGGAIATEFVARSKPDGYTLGLASVSTHAANPAINKALKYDPIKDFSPITAMVSLASVTVVPANSPFKTLEDLLREAKAKPGILTFASPGVGTAGHILLEQLAHLAGVKFSHIPYRGSGPILNDVMSGQLHVASDNAPALLPHIKSGKLRALVVRDHQRLPQLPDVPTYKELGFEPVSRPLWFGLVGPAEMPAELVDRLNKAAHQAMKSASFQERVKSVSATYTPTTPKQFAAQIQRWRDDFKQVVETAKIKIE